MEHHRAEQENYQRVITEQNAYAFDLRTFFAAICATGDIVINLFRPDHEHDENRGKGQSDYEEKNAAIGNEITEKAHGYGGHHVSRGVKCLIAALARVKCARADDTERNCAEGWDEHAGGAADQR